MKISIQVKNFKNNFFNYAIFSLVILITIYKLNLNGSGLLAFIDETRYYSTRGAMLDFSDFEFKSGIRKIFSVDGRPGDALIKIIPCTFQFVTAKILGLNYWESKNSFPLFLFNFFIYSCILIMIYRLANHILKNIFFAFFSILIYSTLTNSHLYLRHAFPYDTSLLFFLFVIYKIILNLEKNKTYFLPIYYLGFFSFFGYLVYPGYILLYYVSIIILVFYRFEFNTKKNRFKHLICYSLGSLSCLIIFETLSRFVGNSYILSALRLSTTIVQGTFKETFVFIFKYLIEVEYLSGITLIVGLPLTLILIIKKIINKEYSTNSIVAILFFSITAIYIIYASFGYYYYKVVFYGRLIHQFLPFICIFLAFSIDTLFKNFLIKRFLVLTLSMLCTINFFVSIENYLSHSYPREIAFKYNKSNPFADITTNCEYENSMSVLPTEINQDTEKTKNIAVKNLKFDKILIINCCFFYPVNDITKYKVFNPNSEQKLLESKKHFLNFKAYQYEGCSVDERKLLDKLSFKIKVFSE